MRAGNCIGFTSERKVLIIYVLPSALSSQANVLGNVNPANKFLIIGRSEITDLTLLEGGD